MFHTVKKLIQAVDTAVGFCQCSVNEFLMCSALSMLHMGAMPGGQVQLACKLREHLLGINIKEIWSSYNGGKNTVPSKKRPSAFHVKCSPISFWIQVLSLVLLCLDTFLYNICMWKTSLPLSPPVTKAPIFRQTGRQAFCFLHVSVAKQVVIPGTVAPQKNHVGWCWIRFPF